MATSAAQWSMTAVIDGGRSEKTRRMSRAERMGFASHPIAASISNNKLDSTRNGVVAALSSTPSHSALSLASSRYIYYSLLFCSTDLLFVISYKTMALFVFNTFFLTSYLSDKPKGPG